MSKSSTSFPFERINFIIMLVGIAVIAFGYLLMIGGGSDDPNVFSEEIFSFRRLTLAPIVILLGFAIEVVAILYTPKKDKQ
jgi:membrane-bound ClpP family serine protease